jgi:hypothetical protein
MANPLRARTAKAAQLALTCAMLALTVQTAAAKTYVCTMTSGVFGKKNDYISTQYRFTDQPEYGNVRVDDALIHRLVGSPILGSRSQSGNTKLVFSWAVDVTIEGLYPSKATYRAAYFPNKDMITLRTTVGYNTNEQATGHCEILKD